MVTTPSQEHDPPSDAEVQAALANGCHLTHGQVAAWWEGQPTTVPVERGRWLLAYEDRAHDWSMRLMWELSTPWILLLIHGPHPRVHHNALDGSIIPADTWHVHEYRHALAGQKEYQTVVDFFEDPFTPEDGKRELFRRANIETNTQSQGQGTLWSHVEGGRA